MPPPSPRILIPQPTSFDPAYNRRSWPEYAAAVQQAGGVPVEVSLNRSADDLEDLAQDAEGIVLPGSGADVDPARYGHSRDPASAPADAAREETDRALLAAADAARLPLLAICFGMQSLNVFRGGTLIQDLTPLPVNHRAGRSVSSAHSILLSPESSLRELLAPDWTEAAVAGGLTLSVNSSHHQAVGIAGEGLAVAARSTQDGVIEAVESLDSTRWLFGLQWHPERTLGSSPASNAIFAAFLQAARQR